VHSEKTPDNGQRNCPKHVEFYSKNKFEKLVHLIGFIIRNDTENIRFQYLKQLHTFYTQCKEMKHVIIGQRSAILLIK